MLTLRISFSFGVWPVLRVVEAVKRLDPMRFGLISPPHTLMLMSSGEIHLYLVKKMVHLVSNKPEQPKGATLAHFEGCRGC